ncbi:2-octaprenyl-6-methoxyphenyl hydroxylase [Vibrio natriegens]|uniref:2-octaprenyl-6-methoxyphenyl hydroxylase n=1 Tax=Vibrio natriegens NBRC 15636 = ATCC 14048 = DSM 759 TaxID=1219067 RepID=A0AAN0Y4L2_VIBNA|nr:2-octaprenyl-6-methoxyphenyl hydroxylase [Vibrio natriegens]ALR14618.1 2-octaprenyl-6-methoxyphenyl hydroxylase [Vibrio natriegens NBRC 15636 = ATCC 14048 = DSM 759]ANQ13517.1 2-octaprenyl-6-methoxyphenyl hydroxylase [Vibrio natriegens NBRC 15636 = ATCC 14048 = DSM 759]EPM41410.1 2-octaprenyl-6-methoxyphenyl hydroxylase [Vibrio natriegens NBRC 15636 = ATCC 14048 = DSM 759]MDX6027960.1 2-octaprenyl-6-methoxyphenyl hydroxylase [Vibrio natriegens NBRC 15636 = ATCC 14048 = DSM 759]UUI11260.1 2-
MRQYDVVIAGGAMAGATLALAIEHLSKAALRIAVVEPFKAQSDSHPGFDSRSIALSYGTVNLLRHLQLWSVIEPFATPIEHIHVSDRSHAGMTDITKQEVGVEALGYVVELADVGRVYQELLTSSASIDFFCPDSVTYIEREQDHTQVELSSGEKLEAKLLVAADGAVSQCCQQVGLELSEHDFEQVAIIANIVTQEPHQGRAFERFTENGPVALLPMSDNRMSLVWCLHPDEAESVLALSESEFLARLQQDFGWRLGALKKVGLRASYPLLLRHRKQNISHRFAIVGNAAQTLHPIAGQGFNLGIRDVVSLAEEVIKQSEDVGRYQGLMRFSQRREADRRETIWLTSSLVHVFSNDLPAMRIGRNAALAAMDNLSIFKQPLLRHTLGLVKR